MMATFDMDPPFVVRSRKSSTKDGEALVTDIMRYALKSYVNEHQGIEEQLDAWVWNWVTAGVGIMKARWETKYSRFIDVVEEPVVVETLNLLNPETGVMEPQSREEIQEVEKEVTLKCFDGPMLEYRDYEDVVIVGGGGDPQRADEVIDQDWLTEGQLWTLADRKIFNYDAVEEALKSGPQRKGSESVNQIKEERARASGVDQTDSTNNLDRYQILERYARIDVDGSGIPSDVVLWVHKETSKILRATYLYRVSKTGKRPYFKIGFHKRHGQDYDIGLIELVYTLTKEIDAIHNMKMDFGLICSMPFGFYKPTSSMQLERMPLEPGMMLPSDNPQNDVYFPNLGAKWSFNQQEEALLMQQIERLTSVSDLNLGVIGGQGATRTATGTRALLGESNANLNIYLKRLNRGWSQLLVYLFEMLQARLPKGFEFRVFADDGKVEWRQTDREALAGMFDFEIEGNSANSNKTIQIEQANNILMTILNPLVLQLGVAGPVEIFNAIKNKFLVEGVRDFSKFIRKPAGSHVYAPIEFLDAWLAGTKIPVTPEQDLPGIMALIEEFMNDDELLGSLPPPAVQQLKLLADQVTGLQQAMAAQEAQVANQQQVAQNMQMGAPSPGAPAVVNQPPPPQQEG